MAVSSRAYNLIMLNAPCAPLEATAAVVAAEIREAKKAIKDLSNLTGIGTSTARAFDLWFASYEQAVEDFKEYAQARVQSNATVEPSTKEKSAREVEAPVDAQPEDTAAKLRRALALRRYVKLLEDSRGAYFDMKAAAKSAFAFADAFFEAEQSDGRA
jgi:predicted flap endonuclease-1-like 5' DNA nuclease